MTIKLFNTMTRKLEEFKPLQQGKVGFYTCGPTVYWDAHIGNMRTIVNSDIIKRVFIENGYDVTHVMNFTDVGHLTSDADSGDDKMEKGAARENMSVWDVAQKYINNFLHDSDLLNIIRPTHTPRATDHIAEQIAQVQKLEEMGYDVFFFFTVGYRDSENHYDEQEKGMFSFAPIEKLDGALVMPDSYDMPGFREALHDML